MIPNEPTATMGCAHRRLFTVSARAGLRCFLTVLAPRGGRILLPAYVGYTEREGSGVLDPVREAGYSFEFYRVGEDLAADLVDLEARIQVGKNQGYSFTAILVVHYFGFPEPKLATLSELSRQFGVVIIEDCAHCLPLSAHVAREGAIGHVGAASVYALHKILPVESGGILQVNDPTLPLPTLEERDRISPAALEVFANADWRAIAQRRHDNAALLLDRLRNVSGIRPLVAEISTDSAPMNLPIVVAEASRHDVYMELRRRGIEATALYYRLVDELVRERFPAGFVTSERILNLPVHQDLSGADMERIAAELNEAVLTSGRVVSHALEQD